MKKNIRGDFMKKILIIEDELELVSLMRSRLKDHNYEVISALNGLEGIDLARQEIPDLIILDVMMPKLDGYNVCRMLKFDEKYKKIPIIILTARGSEQDRNIAQQIRADAFLTKPFRSEILMQEIKKFLDQAKIA